MYNEEVKSEFTPVEQKRHKKHENDHWRLLRSFSKLSVVVEAVTKKGMGYS